MSDGSHSTTLSSISPEPRAVNRLRRATNAPFICNEGYVYAQYGNGVIRSFDPVTGEESSTPIAPPAENGFSGTMNATGIARDGSYAVAIENAATRVVGGGILLTYRFWTYTKDKGWHLLRVDDSVDYRQRPTSAALVAGAISPSTGDYYYGHFTGRASSLAPFRFELYRVPKDDPHSHKVVTLVGEWPNTHDLTFGGDIAFDSAGNLFLVAADRTTESVANFVAKKSDLDRAALNGGRVTMTQTGTGRISIKDANGIAFSSEGPLYLGSDNATDQGIAAHDPFDFAKVAVQPSSFNGSSKGRVDLASCDKPATLVVEKHIVGRKDTGDQFKLSLERTRPVAHVQALTAITDGDTIGTQHKTVGPLPIVSGQAYRITEELVGSGVLSNKYVTAWRCSTPTRELASGSGEAFTLEPEDVFGEHVTCVVTNTPTGSITWAKVSDDPAQTPIANSEWTLSSDNLPANGRTIRDCADPAHCDGTFDEDPRPGHLKVDYLRDGHYTLTEKKAPRFHALDPTPHHITIGNNRRDVDLKKLTNTSYRATVALTVRTVIGPDEQDLSAERADWQLGVSHPDADSDNKRISVNGQHNVEQSTDAQGHVSHLWTVFFDNDTQNLALTLTQNIRNRYAPQRLVCNYTNTQGDLAGTYTLPLHNLHSNHGAISVQIPTLHNGVNAQCTFINARELADLQWEKVDATSQETHLADSKWSLEVPGAPVRLVNDCKDSKECDENDDTDPRPGHFRLRGLMPGDYSLTETQAPAGYEIGTNNKHTFNVTLADESINLGKIHNAQRAPIVIPLTGGHAADTYTITGLALIGLALFWALAVAHTRKRQATSGLEPSALSLPTRNG